MRRFIFVLTLAALSVLVLPLSTPAQQVDGGPVYCEDDSHCGCVGGCQPGGWCMCGEVDASPTAVTPEPLDLDLDVAMASGLALSTDDAHN